MKVVSGHSKAKAPAPHKGRRASSMQIERADNGIMVTTHHEPPKMSKAQAKSSMGMGHYEPPEKAIFNDHAALMKHMADKFGDVIPAKSGAGAGDGGDHGAAGTETEEEESEGA